MKLDLTPNRVTRECRLHFSQLEVDFLPVISLEASAAIASIPQITAKEIPFGIVNLSESSIFVPTNARTTARPW
jgi:hypothetical protein